MAVVWGGRTIEPGGGGARPADNYTGRQALLFTVAALICTALLTLGAFR
jgi:hypothetical protein